jgi:hypothetical protein
MRIEGVTTVEEYLQAIPDDRKEIIKTIRKIIVENLPVGYEEAFNYGMIAYQIPIKRYPTTYNKKPLMLAALAAQKNYNSLYLMTIYGDKGIGEWFINETVKEGKTLKKGKSCINFNKLEELPIKTIGEVIRKVSVEEYIRRYEMVKKQQNIIRNDKKI